MLKYVLAVVVAFLFVGCANKNEVTISNIADGAIYINFRAEVHTIYPNGSATIDDIPNGIYDYSTTYAVPAGYTGQVSGDAAAGTLTFEDKNTKIQFIYSSTKSDTTYTLGCTKSSTLNLNQSTTSTE